MDVNVKNTQQSECNVTPDYRKLCNETLDKLVDKTNELHGLQNKMRKMTHEINNLTGENEFLKETINNMNIKHEEAINNINRNHNRDFEEIKSEVASMKRQIQDKDELIKTYKTFETAKWIIETECDFLHDLKRRRTCDSAN